jgi:hypothetical protein
VFASNYWVLATDQSGVLGNVQVYGTKYKVEAGRMNYRK